MNVEVSDFKKPKRKIKGKRKSSANVAMNLITVNGAPTLANNRSRLMSSSFKDIPQISLIDKSKEDTSDPINASPSIASSRSGSVSGSTSSYKSTARLGEIPGKVQTL